MAKISTEFASRQRALRPGHTFRAVVLIDVPGPPTGSGRRQSGEQHQTAVAARRQAMESVLPDLDRILERSGGRRNGEPFGALGTVLVEVTPSGLDGLAGADYVKALLEDQPVSPFLPPRELP